MRSRPPTEVKRHRELLLVVGVVALMFAWQPWVARTPAAPVGALHWQEGQDAPVLDRVRIGESPLAVERELGIPPQKRGESWLYEGGREVEFDGRGVCRIRGNCLTAWNSVILLRIGDDASVLPGFARGGERTEEGWAMRLPYPGGAVACSVEVREGKVASLNLRREARRP